jgi:hypothetical protein
MTFRHPLLAFAVLLVAFTVIMAACGGLSSDPEISAIQKWTQVCNTYKQTLRGVNDSLELQVITPDSEVVKQMTLTKASLSPICTADLPPADVNRETIQAILDRELIRLIKIQKGIE